MEVPLLAVLVLGCLAAQPEPSAAIPEVGAKPPVAPTVPAPTTSVATALAEVPAAIAARYALSLSADAEALTIDPRAPSRRDIGTRAGGFSAEDSARGGKVLRLDGGPFDRGGWVRASLASLVQGAPERSALEAAGYRLDEVRDLLVVTGKSDPATTVFAFSASDVLGVVGVCSTVTVLDFATPTAPLIVRKPVIYAYPERRAALRIDVDLEGTFVARYPAMGPDGWRVVAEPDGTLRSPDGRAHRYLFWEGEGADFALDPATAHCVKGDDAASFLEWVCDRNALTDAECGDFVTYWLPSLARNPWNLVGFPLDAYEDYARLTVEPPPDTVIRVFLAVRPLDRPVRVGAPALPKRVRSGFTVVEWGGVELPPAGR